MRRIQTVSCLLAILILAACAGPQAPADVSKKQQEARGAAAPLYVPSSLAKVYAFTCEDGFSFTASVEQTSAWLFLPDRTAFLPHRPSLSGGRYSDKETALLLAGDTARLEESGRVHRDCKNHRGRAIWEKARLSGADFRAVGNEPGWHLEIYEGERIALTADYGSTRAVFPFTEPELAGPGKIRYFSTAGARVLEVMIEDESCTDDMNQERFDKAVTVSFDGKTLSGCGRALPQPPLLLKEKK